MLKSPLQVGNILLPNRLVKAPAATEKSVAGKVTDALIYHYTARAKGGCLGLTIVEHSFIRKDGKASVNQLSCAYDEDIEGLTQLAEAIHACGGKTIIQLNHAGGAARLDASELDSISPSGVGNPLRTSAMAAVKPSREMTIADIEEIIECFVAASVRAKKAGFDGVEIHSAHGYLLDQFYSPLTNKRTDEYTGETMDGRLNLHLKVLAAVREAVGPEFLIAMRLGGCDYAEGGSTIEDAVEAARRLEQAGLNLIDLSGGMCFYNRAGHTEAGWFSDMSEAVKQAVSIPVILTGGIKDGASAEQLLREGKADLIGIGRAILADKTWAQQVMSEAE